MALAFLLMIHSRPAQFGRLLRAIHRPQHSYLVHVDKKADAAVHAAVKEEVASLQNVVVMPSRKVRWGGWSMVEVQLSGARTLLAKPGWSHLVNLSGQDFPLRALEAMEAELEEEPQRNYVNHFRPEQMEWIWENPAFSSGHPEAVRPFSRVDRFYVEVPRRSRVHPLPLLRRRFPSGYTWYGGSQWMVLSRAACLYATTSASSRKLRRFYRHTMIPDESFFQTLLMNSPLRPTVVNDSKRTIEWAPRQVIFTMEHLDLLLGSDGWFARKFDDQVDRAVIDVLQQRLAPHS